MAGELTEVYAAKTASEAHQLKNILARAGIQAVVTNTVLEGGAGVDLVGWPTLARVAVAEEDAEAARQMALEFDARISAASGRSPEGPSSIQPADEPARPWPRCPQCDALRITMCPVCGTAGTDFPQADPEFIGTPGLEEGAEPMSCGCGSGGCPPGHAADGADTREAPPTEAAAPPLMLICSTCDEAFVPEHPRRCEWCGHEFEDGYDVEPKPREQLSPQAITVIVGLLVLVIVFIAYFAWLF